MQASPATPFKTPKTNNLKASPSGMTVNVPKEDDILQGNEWHRYYVDILSTEMNIDENMNAIPPWAAKKPDEEGCVISHAPPAPTKLLDPRRFVEAISCSNYARKEIEKALGASFPAWIQVEDKDVKTACLEHLDRIIDRFNSL